MQARDEVAHAHGNMRWLVVFISEWYSLSPNSHRSPSTTPPIRS